MDAEDNIEKKEVGKYHSSFDHNKGYKIDVQVIRKVIFPAFLCTLYT